mmetsp:Transcript_11411/g.30100  ORF Transcript_11411/g.30100 Transcript_11411/m.30100 type:complete len:100 (-) Transcript_11411:986-1285(-)
MLLTMLGVDDITPLASRDVDAVSDRDRLFTRRPRCDSNRFDNLSSRRSPVRTEKEDELSLNSPALSVSIHKRLLCETNTKNTAKSTCEPMTMVAKPIHR